MSKYDVIPITLHTARVEHICLRCNKIIRKGEKVAYQKDDMIQIISKRKYCETCYEELGDKLLHYKRPKIVADDAKMKP